MKYLIVGLGNPGEEYKDTRHNIGFKVLNALAEEAGVSFNSGRLAFYTEFKYKARNLILIKPNTYMNLSGKAVNYWLQRMNLDTSKLLVITDDIALDFGILRMRGKGSDGGHNGIKNINEVLATTNYARLRFGIGSDFSKGKQADYVLDNWNESQSKQLKTGIDKTKKAVHSFCTIGIVETMNKFNGK